MASVTGFLSSGGGGSGGGNSNPRGGPATNLFGPSSDGGRNKGDIINDPANLFGKQDVEFPELTAEEKALFTAQSDLLTQQKELIELASSQFEAVQPEFFRALGFDIGDEGQLLPGEGFSQRADIANQLFERQAAALRGEFSPAIQTDLSRREQELRDRLRKQLGPGAEISTPGMQSLGEFEVARNQILENEISRFGTLGAQSQNDLFGTVSNVIGAPAGLPFGQAASGFGAASDVLSKRRQDEFNANVLNQQLQAQQSAGIGSGLGALAGFFI